MKICVEKADAEVAVAVVGGGPAGLAAATRIAAARIGRVVLLERDGVVGGIPRHCGHSPFGMREYHRVLSGNAYAARLEKDALTAGVEILTRHSVCSIEGTTILVATPDGLKQIRAGKIVLATGVRETPRSARLVSGDRPLGVLTTGALQGYVHLQDLAPFRRPVIVGSELVAMSAILTCLSAGIKPAAIIEESDRLTARFPFRLLPNTLLIPVHRRTKLTAIHGGARVESVTIESDGTARDIACDGVLFTGQFVPESSLGRLSGVDIDPMTGGPRVDAFGRTSNPDIFAVGNLLRPVETAGWCWSESRRIADGVIRDMEGGIGTHEGGVCIRAGRGVKLVVPQSVGQTQVPPSMQHLQVRLTDRCNGELRVHCETGTLWSRRIVSGPERRILIPLDDLKFNRSVSQLTVSVAE